MAIVDLRRCFKLWYAFVVPLLHMSPSINGCIERERQALLAFKQGLVVNTHSQIVSTWGTSEGQNKDCCTWKGVDCSNQTGQVVELQLGSQSLQGSAMDVWGNMSSLAVLNLTDNQLEGDITHSFSELCSLRSLGLSNNNLSGEFPKFVQILSKCSQKPLEGLYLSNNRLSGEIPESIGKMSSLTELSLYGNQLSGRIPASIGQMQSLTRLSLYGNRLSGRIPESIGQMSNLVYINLGKNSLEGVISETHFSKLSKLKYLDLSSNSLVLNFHSDWVPPFQLSVIILWSCKMGPYFPQWLRTQKNYSSLDISNTTISDIIPSWFWGLSHTAVVINLSHNQIRGTFPSSTMEFAYYPKLNFSCNQLEGPIPSFLSKSSSLDLSSNKLSGFISFLCGIKASNLTRLDLSGNHVSEELPDCWTHLENLVVLDLCDNGFLGKIPTTLGNLYSLETLKLKKNRFVGEFPSSLMNCKHLQVFDVAENQLSGLIPGWLLFELPKLVILILRSNRFYGRIPLQLCNLTHVQILDLSINNISGTIPKCLSNLTALVDKGNSILTITHHYASDFGNGIFSESYDDRATLIWKGMMSEYKSTLGLVKSIHLSSNQLTGEIPKEIIQLVGLVSLNLSRNHLTGQINPDIGKLELLQSLDLSRNQIDGRIPTSLFQIYGLGDLDLSNNNLSGNIPVGSQLQNFDPSAFAENPLLCGLPLQRMCDPEKEKGNVQQTGLGNQDHEDGLVTRGFYISMGLGFAFGFWGVSGTLMFHKSGRFIVQVLHTLERMTQPEASNC